MKRLYHAFFYSLDGLKATFKNEPAFRLEIILAVILIPLALWLNITGTEKALLIGTIFLVMIIEILNSAIEAAIDRISQEKHPLSKIAKDAGSAAVLVACVNAAVVWALVLV